MSVLCYHHSCNETVTGKQVTCAAGHYQGTPNVRAAWVEKSELDKRFEIAREEVKARGCDSQLSACEIDLEQNAVAIANFSPIAADNILRNGKYLNYYTRDFQGFPMSSMQNDRNRRMVDGKVYGDLSQSLFFFALSTSGAGLKSYGEISFTIRDPTFLRNNASLLEENSYRFFERHNLGNLQAAVPQGYRSVWADRVKLVIAKNKTLFASTAKPEDVRALVLSSDNTRENDQFIEIVIFGENGKLDVASFERLELTVPLTTLDDRNAWDRAKASAKNRHISVFEFQVRV